MQAEAFADEIIAIADGDAATDPAIAAAMTARDKLRVDARKWIASKLAPKKYGEKVTQEHTGAGGEPLELTVKFVRG